MKNKTRQLRHLKWLIMLAIATTTNSCKDTFKSDLSDCYNTQITFRHYDSPTLENLETYVTSYVHLLFQDDIIVGAAKVSGGTWQGVGLLSEVRFDPARSLRELNTNLPYGSYTLKTWANQTSGFSIITPYTMRETTQSVIELSHVNTFVRAETLLGMSDPLYYGRVDFTVSTPLMKPLVVDMLCAHTQIGITVRWKRAAEAPDMSLPIVMYLDGVPTGYEMTSDHTIEMELGGIGRGRALFNVPAQTGDQGKVAARGSTNLPGEVSALFVTQRFWNTTHPIFSIYGGVDGTTRLVNKEIDWWKYFSTLGIDLDMNLRQQFDLVFEIDGDQVSIFAVEIGDWEEGWVENARHR